MLYKATNVSDQSFYLGGLSFSSLVFRLNPRETISILSEDDLCRIPSSIKPCLVVEEVRPHLNFSFVQVYSATGEVVVDFQGTRANRPSKEQLKLDWKEVGF